MPYQEFGGAFCLHHQVRILCCKVEGKTGTVTMNESKVTCGTKKVLFLRANAEGIITVSVKCCPPQVLIVMCSQPIDPDV